MSGVVVKAERAARAVVVRAVARVVVRVEAVKVVVMWVDVPVVMAEYVVETMVDWVG